jgi:hypothetical protein
MLVAERFPPLPGDPGHPPPIGRKKGTHRGMAKATDPAYLSARLTAGIHASRSPNP